MYQAFEMGFPEADIEVEIMLAIARRGGRRLRRRRERAHQAAKDQTDFESLGIPHGGSMAHAMVFQKSHYLCHS
jgi:hypothetical protein